jgi:hypothetical protein
MATKKKDPNLSPLNRGTMETIMEVNKWMNIPSEPEYDQRLHMVTVFREAIGTIGTRIKRLEGGKYEVVYPDFG